MPGSLNGRVSRLENGRAEPCEECGHDGTLGDVEIKVVWEDLDGTETTGELRSEEPRVCGTCGHQLEYIITWQDLPDPPEAA